MSASARISPKEAAEGRRAGFAEFSAVAVPVGMFGIMFGAAATAAGYSIAMALWASASLFAGASQFVFLDVHREGVPAWSVVLAVFAVNFRHILYSAAMGGKIAHFSLFQRVTGFFLLTDLQFAVTEKRYGKEGLAGVTPTFYFTFALGCYLLWIASTAIGAAFGALIEDPTLIGLDFILPIYFLTILMGFRARGGFVPIVLVSGGVAYLVQHTIGAPWHISLGALAGIATAVFRSLLTNDMQGAQPETPPVSKVREADFNKSADR